MVFKISELRDYNRAALLTVNYATAGLIALGLLLLEGGTVRENFSTGLVFLGIATGVLFICGFYVFAYAIKQAGMGLATGIMRIAVVVPVLASWALWNDAPIPRQLVGLTLACGAFLLISKSDSGTHPGSNNAIDIKRFALLGLLFLVGGLADLAMKTFNEEFSSATDEPLFLLFVFTVACAVGLWVVIYQRSTHPPTPTRPILSLGVVLGTANYGSAAFLLLAISELPAPVVFPANNIAIVLGAALLGFFVWKERFSTWNQIGLACAAVSLALLWS